ncbi:4Fe-4S ferredoxin, iron-sulpur binding domain protein [Gottschalkia acidurici 9a]|uniref:4Fe-4S ferredoxin, iron-sulpur binding domain protein n=1 Tax=Gottschalkia acidurici (strain ATCC 7906 / DSM 604 / BCRC 14475 / CIP 104303 / KCTC 5404 / NCIMB 10678 / 9a) TaxID=1128398 RepID=K0AY03_GOTA9|nr:tRNA epoxyqueuosine(34) reductase QueG [Gottschalkia acidurici]AFS78089.1 4Fe-4S ferredoxin, iron-sulpur binding domain protein [Gottschalkia acidurici 9a]
MNIKKYIIDKCKEVGIDIIGFTNSNEFTELSEFLKNRKEKNYETEFEEKDIEKRISPRKIMGEGETIIVIGVSYDKSGVMYEGISKSSVGTDYHIVLNEKMNKLIDEIKKVQKDFKYFSGVDTTPLIDRYLAKKSGIGWFGRNCSIINDEYGSFIFIGYIITNLKLEEDREVESKCKDCDLCIRSCPVGAIKPNYELNAKRCISYLTQTKETIPYELRDKMENKIYGCDTCQLVCPKNKDIIEKRTSQWEGAYKNIDLEELFKMTNKEFTEKYGHMAFSWRGKNIIKRNIIIKMGNLKNKDYMKLLKVALKDNSPMIRKYSAWSILKIDFNSGLNILEEHIKNEKDGDVISEINNLIDYFKNLG